MTMVRLDVVTPAAADPITLAEAKAHVRAIGSSQDTLIAGFVAAAHDHCVRAIGYPVVTTSMRATLDYFPCLITLPGPSIDPDTVVVLYDDADGAEQTLDPAEYRVSAAGRSARITAAPGASWPTTADHIGAVRVTYDIGRDPADVSASLKSAMLLIIGDLYENRESQIVGATVAENATVDSLLQPHRRVLP